MFCAAAKDKNTTISLLLHNITINSNILVAYFVSWRLYTIQHIYIYIYIYCHGTENVVWLGLFKVAPQARK